MKWLLREVISKARDLQFLFGRQDFWTWRILNYFDLINRLVSDEKTKTKKNWSVTRCKWLDFLQWQTWDRMSSQNWIQTWACHVAERKFGKICREGLLVGYSCGRNEMSGNSVQFWLEIRFPVAHLPGIWFPDPGSAKSVWFQFRAKENLPWGLTLVAERKEKTETNRSDWKSDSLSLTWAPTVQAGPASESLMWRSPSTTKRNQTTAIAQWVGLKTRWLMLIGWSVSWWLVAS